MGCNIKKNKKRRTRTNKKNKIGLFILLSLIMISSALYIKSEIDNNSNQLNQNVLELKPQIEEEMTKQNIDSIHLKYILAMLMQESKGKGLDPFQASESKCNKVNCIKSRKESVKAGVKAYKQKITTINNAGLSESPQLILQSYNYGPNYIDYLVRKNETGYTKENAHKFSKKYCGIAGTNTQTAVNIDKSACYGDYKYVQNVERYLDGSLSE